MNSDQTRSTLEGIAPVLGSSLSVVTHQGRSSDRACDSGL
jgi:hypothetical protein